MINDLLYTVRSKSPGTDAVRMEPEALFVFCFTYITELCSLNFTIKISNCYLCLVLNGGNIHEDGLTRS